MCCTQRIVNVLCETRFCVSTVIATRALTLLSSVLITCCLLYKRESWCECVLLETDAQFPSWPQHNTCCFHHKWCSWLLHARPVPGLCRSCSMPGQYQVCVVAAPCPASTRSVSLLLYARPVPGLCRSSSMPGQYQVCVIAAPCPASTRFVS